jgi:hypothetical protein
MFLAVQIVIRKSTLFALAEIDIQMRYPSAEMGHGKELTITLISIDIQFLQFD